jgi:hypothetical protein
MSRFGELVILRRVGPGQNEGYGRDGRSGYRREKGRKGQNIKHRERVID